MSRSSGLLVLSIFQCSRGMTCTEHRCQLALDRKSAMAAFSPSPASLTTSRTP